MSTNERIPLYQKIQDHVRHSIVSGNMRPGERIPTEKELMEQFGVSKITVVNALAGLANERLITRVPGKGSFVAKSAEKEASLPAVHFSEEKPADRSKQAKGIIGLLMPSIDDYFAIRLIQGVEHALRNEGYRSVIMLTEGSVEKEKEAIAEMLRLGAEGLLIFPVDEENYNEAILGMKLSGFPFILIDRYLPGVETHYIAADGRKGIRLAVEHLWELGHRNIAICSDSPLQTVTVQERIDGYMDALKSKGALINPAHIITDFQPLQDLKKPDDHPLYRYIRNRLVTAYITLNGRLGVQIYQLAKYAGLRVPEDVSVVSFDDPTEVVEEFSIFTHIKQFERDMGVQAASKLLEVINNNEAVQGYSKVLLEPQLMIRQTSGIAPQGDE